MGVVNRCEPRNSPFEFWDIGFEQIVLFPFLAKFKVGFRQSQFPADVLEFFTKITCDVMKRRMEDGESRVDFLQIMLDNKLPEDHNGTSNFSQNGGCLQSEKQGLTHEEILAQSLLFFIAGYETTASTITFLCYCLATNMAAQRELQREIDRMVDISYNTLSDLPYLDMCIQETLRLYPPATRILRACNQDTLLGHVNVRRGTLIAIPVYTLHHNPDYWTDPGKCLFQNGRFLPEERSSRTPYTWLPFGTGPRNCIGMRLAMMEIKVAMVTLVKHLEFHVTDDTQTPLTFRKNTILTTTKPIFVGLKLRG
ncbi:hypothetical protein LSH36_499g02031 [Paralvinella palmiformis]|uniref:Cytochrome P450 n=1 Tax=Paralvinella palmiformis TaxID=53620 RepID=A0AAD9J8Z0_9ANNE|nr:hypothetical protein LSH36_499g02031 [Paralvinella palmiformis]